MMSYRSNEHILTAVPDGTPVQSVICDKCGAERILSAESTLVFDKRIREVKRKGYSFDNKGRHYCTECQRHM